MQEATQANYTRNKTLDQTEEKENKGLFSESV